MSTEDAAARLVRQQFEYQSTGRHAEAAAQFADDAINNGRPASGGRVAGIFATLAEVFPDERHEVEELVSDGELVAARVRFTGTHSAMPSVPFVLGGVLAGIPPTGRSVSVAHHHFFRVRNGRIAEHWGVREDLEMARQLGILAPGPNPALTPTAQPGA